MSDDEDNARSGGTSLDEATDREIVREYIFRLSRGKDTTNRPGLEDTPLRVVRSWKELFWAYTVEDEDAYVRDLLTAFPEEGADEMVVVKGIRVFSFCEHHLLPFYGTAAVGYLPIDGKVIGLSKLARLVQFYAARLSTQERICQGVGRALSKHYGRSGAGCIIEASHLCMCARGARDPDAVTVTSGMYDKFRSEAHTRAEFLQLAGY